VPRDELARIDAEDIRQSRVFAESDDDNVTNRSPAPPK
jgi:hypothetical protein